MFLDRATLRIKSGKGGDGCVSFWRTRRNQRGGPDGGNGGLGGSVYLEATHQMSTLYDFVHKPLYAAENGQGGMGKNMTGRNGEDCVILVPAGTIVRLHEDQVFLGDLVEHGQRLLVARGGKGGRGNKSYANSVNQAPRERQRGMPGEERRLDLELKLIADVGLVGLPNAGKSTLLRTISQAHPKVADYPFTTLKPHLGINVLDDLRRLVVADLPGLIEGAHEGAGLGLDFLRHIERTKVLAHLVSCESGDVDRMQADWETIQGELERHSAVLREKKQLVVMSKMDIFPEAEGETLRKALADRLECPVAGLSAVGRMGIDGLLQGLWDMVAADSAEDES